MSKHGRKGWHPLMSSPFPSSQAPCRVIDIGTPSWCWSQLTLGGEGIISCPGGWGRLSVAVPYTVVGHQISIFVASFNELSWGAAGADIRLEVSGRTADDQRWVVRATAKAERGDHLLRFGDAHARRMHPSNDAVHDPVPSERLYLQEPRVRGFYETLVPV